MSKARTIHLKTYRTKHKTHRTLEYRGIVLKEIEWRRKGRRLASEFSTKVDGMELVLVRGRLSGQWFASLYMLKLGTGFQAKGSSERRALSKLFAKLPAGIEEARKNIRSLASFNRRVQRAKVGRV